MQIPKIKDIKNFMPMSSLDDIKFDIKTVVKKNHKELHVQNYSSFDIEASNGFIDPADGYAKAYSHKKAKKNPKLFKNAQKVSIMYVWQFSIISADGNIFCFGGRTWESYENFIEELSKRMYFAIRSNGMKYDEEAYEAYISTKSPGKIKTLCFVHNLGYEYQHLRNIWEKDFCKMKGNNAAVFARNERSPMKFSLLRNRITWEFRDSYVLTGMSLKNWTKDLKVTKRDEPEWFYLPVLTPDTPLSQERIQYSINDVVSMIHGIAEYAKDYDDVFEIPLTQTGIVRRQANKNIAEVNKEWSEQCREVLSKQTFEDYIDLVDLFAGGWTHANCVYTGKTLKNVSAVDFASSYPAVLTQRTFPLTTFQLCDESEYDWLLSLDLQDPELPYHYWLEFEVDDFDSTTCNTWWSSSKCVGEPEGAMCDNGKIASASHARFKMTDLDFDTFRKAYSFKPENLHIIRMYKSESGYLPKEFILLILKWYGNKTSFKNVEGKEAEYNSSKRSINGIYGCCVTKIFTDLVSFGYDADNDDTGWLTDDLTEEKYYEMLAEELQKSQWTQYQTGVWCTAWARHNLWEGILAMDSRVAYCDTDSIKGLFNEEDKKFIEDYNNHIIELHNYVADKYGFDPELYRPKDPKGIERPLGIFADDGFYYEFKTLGAKRYCCLEKNKKGELVIETTIAGLPKSKGAKKIAEMAMKEYGRLTVEAFRDEIKWDSEDSGKLTAHYLDHQTPVIWKDMNGELYASEARYGLCLEPTSFDMEMTDEYDLLCEAIQEGIEGEGFENMTRIYARHLLSQ